jgi:Mg-chelatase subunit ChlD
MRLGGQLTSRIRFAMTALAGIAMALASSAVAAPRKHQPCALVLVLDKSGSLKGEPLEALKKAAIASVGALHSDDEVAVLAVDHEAEVLVPLQRVSNRKKIAADISRLQAGGGTNVVPGLKAAYDLLRDSKLKVKHIIFISDGESPTVGIPELMKNMSTAAITLSAIGIRQADRNLLSALADEGNGRLYLVDDLKTLSKVLVKETKLHGH